MTIEDWEAVAADRTMDIALLRDELEEIKLHLILHEVVACDFAHFSNPKNRHPEFSWSWWRSWCKKRAPEMIVVYGLTADMVDVEAILDDYAERLIRRYEE